MRILQDGSQLTFRVRVLLDPMIGHAEVKGPYIIVFRKRLLRYPLSNGRLLTLALFHRQVVTRVWAL